MSESTERPQAYDGFGGEVGRIFSTSTPWWPERPDPGAGAPNVIVMLVDDLGFSDLGCFGSEIETPNIDALSNRGVRFTNFHVNPMCSPTRASLMTGLNAHQAGVAHVAHADPGFPGYAMELRDDAVTMAESFRDSGWATFMVGKWHLCKDSDAHEGGSKHSWPLQKGFERFYGILDGFTNFHQPHRLYEDNHALPIDDYPEGYYFTDDLTDRAIEMVRSLRAAHPSKPFFMYFSHGAVHAPLQAKASDIARHEGRYAKGWDAIRSERFERQQSLGVLPPHAVLPPRNSEPGFEVSAWDDLSADEQRLFARYQEIFAAMVSNIDDNLGRLRAVLEASGEWDNTIVVFTSDNGASSEGAAIGTSQYFQTLLAKAKLESGQSIADDIDRFDLLGGPQTLVHYPTGWAMAGNTPFRLYKINTHQGGHQVPLIISWPDGPGEVGALRNPYQHVTDLLPTLADLAGVTVSDTKNGLPTPERVGHSFVEALTAADAPSTHTEQYYENWGHRGYYDSGWSAVTLHQPQTAFAADQWELHDLRSDPTESRDLSGEYPERVADLAVRWESAAWANQVFPLDEGSMLKELVRPERDNALAAPVTIFPGTPSLERYRSLQLILFRSCRIACDFDWNPGDEGTIVAHGDQGGGYGLYVVGGRLRCVYNAYGSQHLLDCGEPMAGANQVDLHLQAVGGLKHEVTVEVAGEDRGTLANLPMLLGMAPFQGIDVGIDRRSPVCWDLFATHGPFPYSGAIRSVTYEPGEFAPDAPHNFLDLAREVNRRYE